MRPSRAALVATKPGEGGPVWLVWTALGIVYLVWGSTYLAIRIMVETMPPLLGAGLRFFAAGVLLWGWLAWRRGHRSVTVTRRELGASALVGTALLLGGNGLVSVAEQDIPSGLAALLISSVPLWVVLWRKVAHERVSGVTLGGVVMGFAGVGFLVLPSARAGVVEGPGPLLVVVAAVFWATGSFFSGKITLPSDAFVATAYEMLTGGAILIVAGAATGELGEVDLEGFSAPSVWAFLYLIFVGSLVAFTAYVWLLGNAPISKVATYAYVNPVVAVFLGWLILGEPLSPPIVLGAVLIVASVAFIVRHEARAAAPRPAEGAGSEGCVEPALEARRP
ncbi:drug/metabolite exporter YedA [soil metagenome]